MAGKFTKIFALLNLAVFLSCLYETDANPAIATGYNALEICIENCAQCKKMFGDWFEGNLCANSCFKSKGKFIPECEDLGSIAPFLNKL